MLVEKAAKKNYIPDSIKEEYQKALFREFKKFLGEKVEEEKSGFLEVVILGPGCYSCNKLEQDVMAVLSESGIQAALNHISDPKLMAQYGILPTPALIVNGKVKSKGNIPPKSMIKKVAGGGEGMTIKKVVLNLSPEETLRLTRILLDEDKEEALSFLKEVPQTPTGAGDPRSLSAGL